MRISDISILSKQMYKKGRLKNVPSHCTPNNRASIFRFHILYKGYSLFPCSSGKATLENTDRLGQSTIQASMQQKQHA